MPTTFGSDSATTDSDAVNPPQDYAKLVRTLEQRSLSRSSSTPTVHGVRGGSAAAAGAAEGSAHQLIEQDLRLAAQIGQSLLTEKAALQTRLEQSERANQKLLERLNKAVRENAAFERVRRFRSGVSAISWALNTPFLVRRAEAGRIAREP